MLKKNYLKYCLFILFLLLSFSITVNVYCKIKGPKEVMIKRNKIVLPLNKNSSAFTFNINVYENQNKSYLCIEQTYRGFIDVYDLKTKKFVKNILYPLTLLRNQPIGFFVNNFDSVYVLLTRLNKLVLLNSQNQIIDTSIYLGLKDNVYPFVLGQPIIKIDNDLLLCAHFNPDAETPEKSSFIVYNMKNNTKRTGYARTEKYNHGWWGISGAVSTSSLTYNKDTKEIVLCFPVDNYIYVYDSQGNSRKYYAGSKYIRNITPFRKKKKDILKYNREIENHYAATGTYSGITWDKYRKVYYRFVIKPIKGEEDYTAPRKRSVIILDKDFNLLGEWDVPAENDLFKSFIIEEGFCIFNKNKYKQCKDSLYFDVYNLNE